MNFFKILFAGVITALPLITVAQEEKKDVPKPNWFNLDLEKDDSFGISTEKTYEQLLKDKKGVPIIVAVIDGGIDVEHEDLKSVLWVNPKEVPGNGKDDDKNGYVDDIHGWNFIGSAKGDVEFDHMEFVRIMKKLQPQYASVVTSTPMDAKQRREFQLYTRAMSEYVGKLEQAKMGMENTSLLMKTIEEIAVKIGKVIPTADDLSSYKASNDMESRVLRVIKAELRKEPDYNKFVEQIKDAIKYYDTQIKYNLNPDFDPRTIVGDSYEDSREQFYGNPNIEGPDAEHGTHVAGIIGAVRDNGVGITGVANNVRLMGIRTVPNGDERDKDVANSIRYAVDNGAKVINMSFGKSYSWDKAIVDEAVKYAVSKDVLLVHAAGNDGQNTDRSNNFPTRIYGDTTDANFMNIRPNIGGSPQGGMGPGGPPSGMPGRGMGSIGGMNNSAVQRTNLDSIRAARPKAENWIEVGAVSWKNDEDLVAEFSNYGKASVDVFAPGVKINSTMPDSKYKDNDGTSMASPVVAGLAALLWSHYPSLSAVQIKDLIIKSVVKPDQKVKISENGVNNKVLLSEISISGGVVNAYNAFVLAQQLYGAVDAKAK
jgi:subtilisin family serine protease